MKKHIKDYKDYNIENKKIFEYNQNLNSDELLEMSNVTGDDTGIDGVIIWIGPNPNHHWKRIKVSNIPNRFDGSDCFTITIPDFKIIGHVDESFINKKTINKIKKFVEINMNVILDYSDYKISTRELLDGLKKV